MTATSIGITPGAGKSVGTTQVGGVDYQVVQIAGGSASSVLLLPAAALADGTANPTPLHTGAFSHTYNDAAGTWDRLRGNTAGTAFALAARTATPTLVQVTNYNARGLVIVIRVTGAGTLGITPSLLVSDPSAGGVTVWTTTQITTIGTTRHLVYPGTATGGGSSYTTVTNNAVPRDLIFNMTHADSSSWTYSVTYHFIV